MKIFITGIGGFLGASLAAHWRAQGHSVSGTSSSAQGAAGDGLVRYRLGDPPPARALEGHDVVVHCAHDFSPEAAQRNREGTRALFEAAKMAGGKKQIYLSSYSARSDSPSRYGATKFAIEQDILAGGGSVVRPGLVAGSGGMFARLARDLERRSFAPLVYPDTKTVALISLPDLLAAFTGLLGRTERRAWNLFAAPLISSREFVEAVWKGQGRSGRVTSVAPWLASGALWFAGLVGIASPANLDSLRSQLANQQPLHQSDLASLVPEPTAPAPAVEEGARQCMARKGPRS